MKPRFTASSVLAAACGAIVAISISGSAKAEHACDDLGAAGWGKSATLETLAEVDSKPYRIDGSPNWYVDRKTTVLPFCNYFNTVGNYSLRSYSLTPEDRVERIEICHPSATSGASEATAPYKGACPPG